MNIRKSIVLLLSSLLMTMVCANSGANTLDISLVDTGDKLIDDNGVIQATPGEALAFDLVVDSPNRPALGGGHDVNFDPEVLGIASYTYTGSGVPRFHCASELQDHRLVSGAYGAAGLGYGY